MAKNKARKVLFEISPDQIEKICSDQVGITVEAIITHANVKMIVKSGDKDIRFRLIKQEN